MSTENKSEIPVISEPPIKIKSPFSGKNNCFLQTVGNDKSYLCMDSGYPTNSAYKIGSEVITKAEAKAPKLVND